MKVLHGHGENHRKVVLSLCDYTGNWPKPWHDAGHTVVLFDLKHGDDLLRITPEVIVLELDLMLRRFDWQVVAVLMACPCDNFTIAGSRWWKGKDANGATDESVHLVRACLAIKDYFRPDKWALENPVGRINSLVPEIGLSWGFHPCDYAGRLPAHMLDVVHADPVEKVMASNRYTKHTRIYGPVDKPEKAYVEPLIYEVKSASGKVKRGSVIWAKLGGKSERTKTLRAMTPMGFSGAFKERNTA